MPKSPKLATPTEAPQADLAAVLRQHAVEQFYYLEAAHLDNRRHEEWLKILDDDVRYWMPIRRTRTTDELDKEFTSRGAMAFYDDDKAMLAARVRKLDTGYSWAEDPPSRTRHMVTNVKVVSDNGSELHVTSNFHLYRTRLNSEEDNWFGERRDVLRRVDGTFKIANREIYLDQTVILSRNLSSFF